MSADVSISRDLQGAKDAYDSKDVEASKIAHSHGKEPHQGATGEYIQAIVFGGLDGIITTFAVVIAAAAAKLSYGTILIIGFANLLADALGMGIGDFLSTKAEDDHAKAEKKRERWEIENMPIVEKKEMRDVYIKKGLSKEDAAEIVDLLFPSTEAFLDIMMIEELGLLPSDSGDAWKSAIITFVSFIIFGGLPMLPYLFSVHYTKQASVDAVFWAAIAVFVVSLFALGAFKGRITGQKWYITGTTMLVNGGVTTGIAFVVGYALSFIK